MNDDDLQRKLNDFEDRYSGHCADEYISACRQLSPGADDGVNASGLLKSYGSIAQQYLRGYTDAQNIFNAGILCIYEEYYGNNPSELSEDTVHEIAEQLEQAEHRMVRKCSDHLTQQLGSNTPHLESLCSTLAMRCKTLFRFERERLDRALDGIRKKHGGFRRLISFLCKKR